MAQVVCQIVHKPGRMSILWSAEDAAFEPIHLEGDALVSFEQAARRGRQLLAEAGLGGSDGELVNVGRELHARFFAGDVGAEVARWLRGLESVEALEMGTDAPGRVPYALFDDPELPGAWGRRFPLTVGRRANPMRMDGPLARSNVLVALDVEMRGRIGDTARLDGFLTQTGAQVVGSRRDLRSAISQDVADVIWLLTRLEGGAWIVGGERVTPQELATWIRESDSGNPRPIVVSTGVAAADAVTSWECFLSAATGSLPGMTSLETPATPAAASDIGLSLLTAFLIDKTPMARALQQVRLAGGALGLSLAGYVPANVRLAGEGAAETRSEPPLPAAPYHPLRPLEREDRALLFGREDDIAACALTLGQPNVAGLLVHGRGGVGKASFVRAGLLPFLEEDNRGFYVLRDRTDAADSELEQPTIALRTGPDLAGSLIMGLTAFAARPFVYTTPTGRTVTVDLPAILFGSRNDETAIQDLGRTPNHPQGDNASESWREHPKLKGRFLPDHPDDLQVFVHDGGPRITSNSPEAVWVTVTGMEGEVFRGRVLNEPHNLQTVRKGSEIKFVVAGAKYPVMVTDKYLQERGAWEIQPCKCGLSELFDAPSDLNRAVFPNQTPDAEMQMFTALCPLCGGFILVKSLSLSEDGGSRAGSPAQTTSPSAIWDKVRDDPAALADMFDRVSRDLPFDLLIPLEQLEDAVVLPASNASAAAETLAALARSPGRFHVVATLRTECLGEVQTLLGADYARAAWKDYFLDEVSEAAVNEALLAPTRTAAYEFDFDAGIATNVLAAVKERVRTSGYSAVQLVHAFGGRLYDECRSSNRSLARQIDLDRIVKKGPVESLVESKLKSLALNSSDTAKVRRIVGELHRTVGGVVTRDLTPLEAIERKEKTATPIQEIVNRAVERGPLLEAHNLLVAGRERLYVTVPQDLLANYGEQQGRVKSYDEKIARKRVLDSLFLWIPMTVLGMAIVFFLISRYRARATETARKLDPAQVEEVFEKGKRVGERIGGYTTRFTVYSGALAQADDAIRQGNTLRARQWLMTQQPQQGGDLRGFEWFYLWRKISGEEATLLGHKALVRVLAMSTDGKRLVSGDESGDVLLWNLDDLKEPLAANLKGLKGPVQSLAFSPDGNAVAGVDGNAKALVWGDFKFGKAVADVEPKASLEADGGKGALSVAYVDNGSLAVGGDNGVTLFDVAEKKAKWTAREHSGAVKALAVLDGGKLVSASDKELIAWTSDGKKAKEEKIVDGTVVALSAARSGVATALVLTSRGGSGSLSAWTADGKLIPLRSGLPGANAVAIVSDTHLTPDLGPKLLAVAGSDQVIRLMSDVPLAKVEPLLGHVSAVRSVAGAGMKLASVGYDNGIKLWDVAKVVGERDSFDADGPVQGLAFDPGERFLASAGGDAVRFWDPSTGAKLGEVKVPNTGRLAFTPKDKSLLLAASSGNDAEIFELTFDKNIAAKPVATLKKHAAAISCVAFSFDGKTVATAGLDKTVMIWSVPDGKHVRTIEMPASATAMFYQGDSLIVGNVDGVGLVFNTANGKLAYPPSHQHGAAIHAIALVDRKSGGGLASVSSDQSFRRWAFDQQGGKWVDENVFRGHYQPILCMAQGKGFFATGGQDGTVKFWDMTLSDERYTFNAGSPVRALALANGKAILAVANDRGTIHLLRGAPRPSYGPVNLPPPPEGQGHPDDGQ